MSNTAILDVFSSDSTGALSALLCYILHAVAENGKYRSLALAYAGLYRLEHSLLWGCALYCSVCGNLDMWSIACRESG